MSRLSRRSACKAPWLRSVFGPACALLLLLAASPAEARWLGLGFELGSTTRWTQSESARRLGDTGGAAFSFALGLEPVSGLRLELTRRAYSDNGNGPVGTSADWSDDQWSLAAGYRFLDLDWLSLHARLGLGVTERQLQFSGYGTYVTALDGWSPLVEAALGAEFALPRKTTGDRFSLGLRFDLGLAQVFGKGVELDLGNGGLEGATAEKVSLGSWNNFAPTLRVGLFVRR